MKQLKECLELRCRIREVDESMEEIKAMLYTPKCQDLSGMPRGGGGNGESIIDKLITKKGKLEQKRKNLVNELCEKWNEVESACDNAHISKVQRQLLSYRYFHGLSWKVVTKKMHDYTGQKWNENKTYRIHRIVLCKLNKRNEKTA